MDQFVIRTYPIEKDKIDNLCKLISSHRLIVPSFEYDFEKEIYDISYYLKIRDMFQTDVCLLPDRNLLTRWLALYRGEDIKNDNDRLAASILAFSQLAEIVIEPSIALYEAAMTNGNVKANQELNIFRSADNLDPKYWTAVALEESDMLPNIALNDLNKNKLEDINFEMPLRRWRRLYVLVLKIAEIELQGENSHQCMSELFKWMHKDYLMTGTAVILAAHYFAPNNNRKGLFKKLRSLNRELAIQGIKNATWDLFILEEWFSRITTQDKENKKWLFCTLDKKLKLFAESLIYKKRDVNPLESSLINLFGIEIGGKLMEELKQYRLISSSHERILNQENNQPTIASLIEKGEKIIFNWSV